MRRGTDYVVAPLTPCPVISHPPSPPCYGRMICRLQTERSLPRLRSLLVGNRPRPGTIDSASGHYAEKEGAPHGATLRGEPPELWRLGELRTDHLAGER